jgi:EAL domain-containing protein (putative c-di-GMP-specific phosphodiesterase class I)
MPEEASSEQFSFAYQPIVDTDAGVIFAYEALVRGHDGQSAPSVLSRYPGEHIYRFDWAARIAALQLAARLGLSVRVSLNFLPRSLEKFPDAVAVTADAAIRAQLPLENLILEVTEGEAVHDPSGFAERMNEYRAQGIRFAIDDFGAGYAGLALLAEFQPDIVKLDMQLVRNIDSKGPRQAIVRAIIQVCDDLGIDVVAEGLETEAEYHWFRRRGVHLFQGYYFARPAFEALPTTFTGEHNIQETSLSIVR